MIEVQNVSKTIKGNMVLKDITYVFEEGSVYLLKGHNGCGKTMLLRVICGLLRPDAGVVRSETKKEFGVVIENPSFNEHETVMDNLRYLASIRHKITDQDILEGLRSVNLYELRNTKVKKLSLGMKQRLAICQAIMESPDVLLLDEPFNALDEENINAVKKIIKSAKDKNKVVIIAAHQIESEMLGMFDYIINMKQGQII